MNLGMEETAMEIEKFISQLNDKLTYNSGEIQTIENSEFDFRNTEVYVKDYLEGKKINSCIIKDMFNNIFKEKFAIGLLPVGRQLIAMSNNSIPSSIGEILITQSFDITKDFYIGHFVNKGDDIYTEGLPHSKTESVSLTREIYDDSNTLIDQTKFNTRLEQDIFGGYYYFDNGDKAIVLPKGSYIVKWNLSVVCNKDTSFNFYLPALYCYPQNTIDLTI